jgi:uncharacterized membrane protein
MNGSRTKCEPMFYSKTVWLWVHATTSRIGPLGSGALSGSLVDYGINDDFIWSLGQTLPSNSSALFLLVKKAQPEKVLAEMSKFRGRVLRTSLSPDQERRLQAALSGEAMTASQ